MRLSFCWSAAFPLLILLAGCGPSPEQSTALTAAASSPTPAPTAAPTPVPYDLTVTVTNKDGASIAGATLVFPGSGSETPVQADERGAYVWRNLPSEAVEVQAAAQGYRSQVATHTMVPGPNGLVVLLERDPDGLLPSAACGPSETLLYIEDFQDAEAAGWPEIEAAADGWSLGEYPEGSGNRLARVGAPERARSTLANMSFADAVWRIRYRVDGRRDVSFNWQQGGGGEIDGQQVDDWRYQVVIASPLSTMRRLALPALNVEVSHGLGAWDGTWHQIEISSYQGEVQLWIDGVRHGSYVDPTPLPAGSIGFELLPGGEPDAVASFDNIAVCKLSAAFATLYAP